MSSSHTLTPPSSPLTLLLLMGSLVACGETSTTPPDTPCMAVSTPFKHTRCVAHDPKRLSLHWQNDQAKPLYTFDNLIAKRGEFAFAMNAGMYDREFAPIGYTVIDGKLIKKLNTNEGEGNFHLMPNGVFWWNETGAFIDTTPAFADKSQQGITPTYATQSGPMLVIDGQIHPKFDPNGTSKKLRNGVGVDCTDGRTHFVISDEPVTFYAFADVFKSGFGCQNALFLDGGIASALYAKHLNRHDNINMAVMIAYR